MKDGKQRVLERRFELELAEAEGREVAPDRVDAILKRLATGGKRSRDVRAQRMAAALVCAALVPVVWLVVTHGSKAAEDTLPVAVDPAVVALPAGVEPPPPPTLATPPETSGSATHVAGTDPADLAAQRSAEKMLEVERSFEQRVRDGALPDLPRRDLTILPFPVISGWNYTRGLAGVPDSVRDLDGDEVAMLGFMLPLDEVSGMRRFLLVQSLWSCCYGTPPDVNGIVLVQMPVGRTTEYSFEPIAVVGTFRVRERIEDGYVVDVFQLDADMVVVVD